MKDSSDQSADSQNPQDQNPPILFDKKNIIVGFILIILLIPLALFVGSKFLSKKTIVKPVVKKEFKPATSYRADQIIVKYKDNYTITELESLKSKLKDIGVVSQEQVFTSQDPKLKNYFLLTLKPGTDVVKVINSLQNFTAIEGVSPNYMVKVQAAPSDPEYSKQWDMAKINMPDAWNLNKGSNSVKVAVVDSGIDFNHPDFAGRTIVNGENFSTCAKYDDSQDSQPCIQPRARGNNSMDDNGHGTHVAGTIGAVANNSIGMAGINWNVTLLAVKIVDADGEGEVSDFMDGIRYAADQGAKVINLSISTPSRCSDIPGYQSAIDYAITKGAVVVGAAGNDGDSTDPEISRFTKDHSPPSCNGVIAVGATGPNDGRASFSDYDGRTDISAPGMQILSLKGSICSASDMCPSNSIVDGNYLYAQGTSMATPHVSGVAALLLSQNPSLSVQQVKDCLIKNADQIHTDQPIGPRLNAAKALNACSGQTAVNPTAGNPTVIKGVVFIDQNSNDQFDAGETGYSGAKIILEGQSGLSINSDVKGEYRFTQLTQGDYKVDLSIGGQIVTSSQNFTLSTGNTAVVMFPLPPAFAQNSNPGNPNLNPGTPGGGNPNNNTHTTPTPTPVKTYSCHMKSSTGTTGSGAIQIGNLECTPNP